MQLWHVNFATEDRLPLFPEGLPSRRRALVKLGELANDQLALFCIVDDHNHLCVLGDRAAAGRFVQRLRVSWKPLLHPFVQPAYYRKVTDRSHLLQLVSYMVRQPEIHDLGVPNALWEGSCFSDLVGARVVPNLRLRVHDLLPRLSIDNIFRTAGLPGAVPPASPELIAQQGPERLVAAGYAALAIDDPSRKDRRIQLARRAIVAIADQAGLRRKDLASAMGCSARTLRRSSLPSTDHIARAVRLRLAIDSREQHPR